ncbi:putative histone H2A [Trypanosoma cruzi]|nr:putative histone H2A [Trypanosoma cruzi]
MATPKQAAKKASKKHGGGRSAKAGLIFPVGRVGSLLRRGQYARRIGASGAVYMAAVLEYLTAELLELSVKAASQQAKKPKRLTPRTVTLAVRHDDDLGMLLKNVTLSRGGVMPSLNKAVAKKHKSSKKARATPALRAAFRPSAGTGRTMLDAPGWPSSLSHGDPHVAL